MFLKIVCLTYFYAVETIFFFSSLAQELKVLPQGQRGDIWLPALTLNKQYISRIGDTKKLNQDPPARGPQS